MSKIEILKPIIEILLDKSHINPEIRQSIGKETLDDKDAIGYLEKIGIPKTAVTETIEKYYGVNYIDLRNVRIGASLQSMLDFGSMRKENILPYLLDETNRIVYFAISDLGAYHIKENISHLCRKQNYSARFAFAFPYEINEKYTQLENEKTSQDVQDINKPDVIEWVDQTLTKGIKLEVSDIHIEPKEKGVQVRYRIDGVLSVKEVYDFSPDFIQSIISRIKIISGMNIAEKRRPQSGRIDGITYNNQNYNFRTSSISTIYGEKVVLRVFTKDARILTFNELGFTNEDEILINNFLSSFSGIIYLSGATGSGKTTTLYSMINTINSDDINICTIEDPVERVIPDINQTEINPQAGVTYTSALKAFLRQDPDVIIVGEIRDHETAELSVRASLTGHLVISTIHANTALDTISRLYNMDIELYLLGASALGFISQRLIRVLCPYCKEKQDPTGQEKLWIERLKETYALPDGTFYTSRGCPKCNHTGFKGRTVIAEISKVTEEIKEMIIRKESIKSIRAKAIEQGFVPLEIKGYHKALEGKTSLKEIIKAVSTKESTTHD